MAPEMREFLRNNNEYPIPSPPTPPVPAARFAAYRLLANGVQFSLSGAWTSINWGDLINESPGIASNFYPENIIMGSLNLLGNGNSVLNISTGEVNANPESGVDHRLILRAITQNDPENLGLLFWNCPESNTPSFCFCRNPMTGENYWRLALSTFPTGSSHGKSWQTLTTYLSVGDYSGTPAVLTAITGAWVIGMQPTLPD
jgi:hypothetical protein